MCAYKYDYKRFICSYFGNYNAMFLDLVVGAVHGEVLLIDGTRMR